MDDNATLAVLLEQVNHLSKRWEEDRLARQVEYKELREELRRVTEGQVPRGEWAQRNSYVDSKFDAQGREISDIKTELASKRLPMTAWIAIVIAVLTFAWTVLGPVLTSGPQADTGSDTVQEQSL